MFGSEFNQGIKAIFGKRNEFKRGVEIKESIWT